MKEAIECSGEIGEMTLKVIGGVDIPFWVRKSMACDQATTIITKYMKERESNLVETLKDVASELNRLRYKLDNQPERVGACEDKCRQVLKEMGNEGEGFN